MIIYGVCCIYIAGTSSTQAAQISFFPVGSGSSVIESQQLDILTESDHHLIGYMLSDAIAPSTRANYNGHGLPMWRTFLKEKRHWSSMRLASDTIVCLQESHLNTAHKIQLFILYCHFLKANGVIDCNLHFKALAHDFRSLGYFEVAELLHSKMVNDS
jgi:hypothetical protein